MRVSANVLVQTQEPLFTTCGTNVGSSPTGFLLQSSSVVFHSLAGVLKLSSKSENGFSEDPKNDPVRWIRRLTHATLQTGTTHAAFKFLPVCLSRGGG
eukprot:3558646-Amphidinium_carterae.1